MVRIPINVLGEQHINVESQGSGLTVVALHGFTGSLLTWSRMATLLMEEFTVVMVDLPGHGASAVPSEISKYSMESHMRILIEVLDHLNLRKVIWLGYSLGGRIALSTAVSFPERTMGLVVESGSPGLPTAEEREQRCREDAYLADWIEDVGVSRFVDYWQAIPLWVSQSRLVESEREKLRAQRLNNDALGLANSLRGVGTGSQPALHSRLSKLDMQVLLLAGAEDAKYVGIAQEMHHVIPASSLEIVPESGHAIHLEQPERFDGIVQKFLRTVV
jgi:2-succinyl-6-hydroxy-2,4-cyclohexadiene-1-carboxylate synthase